MADSTFSVLDAAGATVTFRAQAVVGTTLVMMSVPSNLAGTALIGQAVMATSIPVAIASNQSNVPFNLVAFGGTTVSLGPKVSGTSIPVVIAIDQLSPLGSTTMASSAPVVLATDQVVSTNLMQVGAVAFSLGQKVMATSIPVAIASNQSAVPVTNSGGTSTVTLAGGTALVTLGGGTTAVNLNQIGGSTLGFGQAVMATSIPVAVASNQASISIAHDSNRLMNGDSGSTMTPKFALISVLTTSGVNQIVTAVASRKIRVVAWDAVASGAVNIKWQSVTTDITGLYYLSGTGSGLARGWNPNGYFETAIGSTLNVNLSATVAIGGCLTYVEV